MLVYECLYYCMLFNNGVRIIVRLRLIFSAQLVSGYAHPHVFIVLSVGIVPHSIVVCLSLA